MSEYSNNPSSSEFKEQHPSDWQKTINEQSGNNTENVLKETTSPGELGSNGLPIPEALLDRTLGSGKIVGYIGSGGMGDVYQIWNEHINRHHAVKLLKYGSDVKLEKRFQREIKITATFDHPNIVRVHGAGKWKGYLYLEMEYIGGDSLEALLKKNKSLPFIIATAIGIVVSRALTYAHEHSYTLDGKTFTGVIHRDLKPSNIMLSNDGKIKLMDFGISRPVGGELATLTVGIVGSWAYLPPEQLDGCAVDLRADIYTLGEVLYEIVTGKAPFVFENQREFLRLKSRGKYTPISQINPGVPETLTAIIDKCLKVNPDARFQSAREVEHALSAFYGTQTSASPESALASFTGNESILPLQTESKSSTRVYKKILPFAGALAAVFIVVFIVLFTRNQQNTTSQNSGPVPAAGPLIISPKTSDTCSDEKVTFLWHAVTGTPGYLLHVSSNKEFTDTLLFLKNSDTSKTVPIDTLLQSGFWRIGSIVPDETTAWSSTQQLNLTFKPLAAPDLLLPANNKKRCPLKLSFKWKPVPGAKTYHFQISKSEAFPTFSFEKSVLVTNEITVNNSLSSASTYYWRVQAKRDRTFSAWSPVYAFTTKDTSTNFANTAAAAIKKNDLSEAESVLKKMKTTHPQYEKLYLEVAERRVNQKDFDRAWYCLRNISDRDMYSDILKSRIYLGKNQCSQALNQLKNSDRKKTCFDRQKILGELVYIRALAMQCRYMSSKNDRTKIGAITAWGRVCDHYGTEHSRCKEADRKSSEIANNR